MQYPLKQILLVWSFTIRGGDKHNKGLDLEGFTPTINHVFLQENIKCNTRVTNKLSKFSYIYLCIFMNFY